VPHLGDRPGERRDGAWRQRCLQAGGQAGEEGLAGDLLELLQPVVHPADRLDELLLRRRERVEGFLVASDRLADAVECELEGAERAGGAGGELRDGGDGAECCGRGRREGERADADTGADER
jgi:hypothetical protein